MDVLIVEPIERDVVDWLAARHSLRIAPELARDPLAFRRALGNARAVIVPPGMAFDQHALAAAPHLAAVARVGPGAEGIDLDACLKAKVEVVRSLVASAAAEAEFMLGALLKLMRRLPEHGRIREGRELGTATVGLIGMSPAARSLSQLLVGFGSRLIGYDPAIHATDGLWARWRVRPVGLRELLSNADAVCVQLQYFSRYKGLLGERLLPHCKSNQVIVCISPSAVFDEAALARALEHGIIAAAWLDNVEPGLLEAGRPLAGSRRLCTSPQLAGHTREARQRGAWTVIKRLDEVLRAAAAPQEGANGTSGAAAAATLPAAPAGLAAGPASH